MEGDDVADVERHPQPLGRLDPIEDEEAAPGRVADPHERRLARLRRHPLERYPEAGATALIAGPPTERHGRRPEPVARTSSAPRTPGS